MKTLGKFEVVEKIGQGAMGVVYKARDPFIGRLVALKTITVGLAEDPALLERFYQEARSAGALQHPNIVTIYELGREGDTPFIAMEFLEGGSLDKIIDNQVPLSVSQKVGYIVHICRALEYAHARGVIHRDIKPGNVMVTSEGAIKVVDFGIARLVGSGRTQTGILIGTLGYMSDQLIRGKHADARSDIWAVGVMFYELLAHHRPFQGENQADLMMNILTQATPPIPGIGADVPAELEPVIGKMLQKNAAGYQSMQELLIDLDPIWDRMKKQEVSQLIEAGQQFLKAGELDKAQELLHRAMQADTTNVHAKSLAEKISAEIRRQQIVPQVKARVQKAEVFLSNRQFEEAKAEAEAALQLDSTFQPARTVLQRVQEAAERERALAQALRTCKQRLVEGDLAEAKVQLAKAFEIEPSSAAALDLERQIREEESRRERQKKLAEIKHRARTFWSELRYQECIDLLQQARDEFPNDLEIAKILETAQQDKAEHEKQTMLAEARSLVGAQRFDDALKVLDNVFKLAPADTTASNLRNLALQGREQQIIEQQLRRDIESLRTLVKDGKYQEAINRGEELLRQFPREFEVGELLAYAKNEQAQLERKIRRDQWLEKINRAIAAEHYAEAIQSAEAAMGEFARDIDIKILLEKAKQKQQEKERAEQLERRIREVRAKINREELTDAIAMARETIITLGPSTDIRQLLNQAEVEYGQREKKRQNQQDALHAAKTLIDHGNFADATREIEDALATRLFTPADPQVTALLRDIDLKKTPPPPAPPLPPPAAAPRAPSSAPAPTPASWTTPGGDPAKDYVYQQGMRLPDAPPAPPQDGSASMIFSATSVSGPSAQPVLPPPPPPPAIPEIKEPSKGKKKKRDQKEDQTRQDFEATRIDQGATQIGQPVPEFDQGATIIGQPTEIASPAKTIPPPVAKPVAPAPPPAQRAPVAPAAPPPAVRTPVEAVAAPVPAAQPVWRQPIALVGVAVLLLALGGAAYYFHSNSKPEITENQPPVERPVQPPVQAPIQPPVLPPPPPAVDPLAQQQDELIKQATKLAGGNDYDGAIAKLNQADGLHGPRTADIARLRNAYTEDKSNRALADLRQKEQGLWDTANGDFGRNDLDQAQSAFQQIVSLPDGGVYKKDAQDFLGTRIPNRRDAERLFDSASQQAKQAKDEDAWRQVANNLQQALTKGLSEQHDADARSLLTTANTNAAQMQGDRENFTRLQTQFNNPATQKDKQALQGVLDGFRKLSGENGPYKQQSTDYASKAESLLTALNAPAPVPTPTPTPTPAPVVQQADPQVAIKQIFGDLSQAFAKKNIELIQQLWPSMTKQYGDTLRSKIFGNAQIKIYSRNFNLARVTVNGDTASVSGTYSGVVDVGFTKQAYNGSFQAELKSEGGRWVIANLVEK